jgi:hypothetical protein
MSREPANDDEEYVTGVLDCSMDEFFAALMASGSDIEFGLLTDDGFLVQANDE